MDFVCTRTYAADPKARGARAGAGSPARRALRLGVAGAVPGAAVAGAVGEPEIEFQLENIQYDRIVHRQLSAIQGISCGTEPDDLKDVHCKKKLFLSICILQENLCLALLIFSEPFVQKQRLLTKLSGSVRRCFTESNGSSWLYNLTLRKITLS